MDTPCCPPRGSPWRCCFDIRGPLPWAGREGFGRRTGRVAFGRWQEQVWKPLTLGGRFYPLGWEGADMGAGPPQPGGQGSRELLFA